MDILKTTRLYTFGFLTWLVPFLFSLPFFSAEGELLIDIFLFKRIMLLLLGSFATFLLVYFLKPVKNGHAQAGLVTGAIWFLINFVLDLIVLVGLLGNPLSEWFVQTGLGYLLIPILGYALGKAAENSLVHTS